MLACRWARAKVRRLCVGLLAISVVGVVAADDRPEVAPGPGTRISILALTGQPAPDGHGIIAGLRTAAPLLNEQGQTLFVADIHEPDIDIDAHALLRGSGQGGVLQLSRAGEALPGGASFGWLRSTQDICLDDEGRVAVFVPDDADNQVPHMIDRIDPDGRIEARHRALQLGHVMEGLELADYGGLPRSPWHDAHGSSTHLARSYSTPRAH